jgi:hypothetical protein
MMAKEWRAHIAYRDADAATRAQMDAKDARVAAALDRLRVSVAKLNGTNSGNALLEIAGELAAKARTLITENDPDVIRTGLAELAEVLEAMANEAQ